MNNLDLIEKCIENNSKDKKWIFKDCEIEHNRALYRGEVSKLGENFYIASALCPECKCLMYKRSFNLDKKYIINTEKEVFFISKVYTCPKCKSFFASVIDHKLCKEKILVLDFQNEEMYRNTLNYIDVYLKDKLKK